MFPMRNSWPNYKIQWSPSEKTHANSKAKVVLRKVGGGGGGGGGRGGGRWSYTWKCEGTGFRESGLIRGGWDG